MKIMKMMKEAASMQREMKKIQKQLAKETVEFTNGAVTVVARCDMSVANVKIDPAAITAGNEDKVERQVTDAVNGAMNAAKKKAGSAMSQMGGGLGGIAEMLGQ